MRKVPISSAVSPAKIQDLEILQDLGQQGEDLQGALVSMQAWTGARGFNKSRERPKQECAPPFIAMPGENKRGCSCRDQASFLLQTARRTTDEPAQEAAE